MPPLRVTSFYFNFLCYTDKQNKKWFNTLVIVTNQRHTADLSPLQCSIDCYHCDLLTIEYKHSEMTLLSDLPSSTPVTMDAKLSSNRIISAACLLTSDPAIPMATPTRSTSATLPFAIIFVRITYFPCSAKRKKRNYKALSSLKNDAGYLWETLPTRR